MHISPNCVHRPFCFADEREKWDEIEIEFRLYLDRAIGLMCRDWPAGATPAIIGRSVGNRTDVPAKRRANPKIH